MENRGVNRNYKMARRFLSFFLVLGINSNIKQLKGTLTKDKALKVGQKAPRHFTPSRARAYLKESTTHRDQTKKKKRYMIP